jgi:hypothetical protein
MNFLKKLFGQSDKIDQRTEPIFPGESFSISKLTLQGGWKPATFNNKYSNYPNGKLRSALGFGESLIAVPLFLLFLPVEIAEPLSVMLSIIITLVVVIQDHKKIHFDSAKWLISYAMLGILISVLGYYSKGLITSEVSTYFIISLITTIPAIFLDRYLNHHQKDGLFFKYAGN